MSLLSRTVAEVASFIDLWEPQLSDEQRREILRAIDHIRGVIAWDGSRSPHP